MKNVAMFTQLAAFFIRLCVMPMFLMLLSSAGPTLAQAVRTCANPLPSGTSSFDISESACKGEATIGFASPLELPVWKTIDVGVYHDANAVRQAFNRAVNLIHVDEWANEILGRMAFLHAETKLNLVITTVSALGFGEDGASLKDIYARASQLGLALCPAEVGPILRLDYLDQPLDEFLHIAMNPVSRSGGEPTDFTVANGGAGLLLLSGDARSDLIAPGNLPFVFVRPATSAYPPAARSNDDCPYCN